MILTKIRHCVGRTISVLSYLPLLLFAIMTLVGGILADDDTLVNDTKDMLYHIFVNAEEP